MRRWRRAAAVPHLPGCCPRLAGRAAQQAVDWQVADCVRHQGCLAPAHLLSMHPAASVPRCSQQVVDFVHQRLAKGVEPRDIASELLNACLANDPREARGIGCDNMTAAVRCGSGICSRKLCADAAAQGCMARGVGGCAAVGACHLACCLPNSPCSPPRRLWCSSRARGRCGTAAAPAARARMMRSTRWPTATTRAAAAAPAAGAVIRRCERRRLCRKRHRPRQQRPPPRRDVRRSLLARAMLWGALPHCVLPHHALPCTTCEASQIARCAHWHRCRPLHPFSLLPLPTCCCHLSATPVACSAADLTLQTCLFPASVAPRKGAVYSGSYRAAVYVWKLPSIPSADSPVPPFLCVVSAP